MSWMSYVRTVLVHTRMCMNVVSFSLLTRPFSGLGLFDFVRLAGQWAPEISPEL